MANEPAIHMYHKWHISPPYFRENIIFHITEYEVSYKSLKLIDYDILNALSLQQISKNKFNHLIEMHINYHISSGIGMTQQKSLMYKNLML